MLTGTTQKNNLALSTKAAYPVTQQFHISSYSQEKYVLMVHYQRGIRMFTAVFVLIAPKWK